jgi:alpha-L-rhamnosidase
VRHDEAVVGALIARRLQCERVVDPLGVANPHPAFSWVPDASRQAETQTAYRVLVASDREFLLEGRGDLWDSGRVVSPDVSGVRYEGRPLTSRERAWWSVQLWDRAGVAGSPSASASFEMGLLRADDWRATWIGGNAQDQSAAPYLRSEFSVSGEVRFARAYVSALGYYELRINGARVGDRLLDPVLTTHERDFELRDPDGGRRPARIRSSRVSYSVFDVTEQIGTGTNAVGVILGDGWYASGSRRPQGLVQLEIELVDGDRVIVLSDDTWRASTGAIVRNSPVDGEHHDSRREPTGWDLAGFDDTEWEHAALHTAPNASMVSTVIEPVRLIQTIPPSRTCVSRDGIQVLDFGQHISGWARVRVSGPSGSRVTLRFAGDVDDAGEIDDVANTAVWMPARQTDTYVLDGSASATWEPRFTLHGFQYVEISCVDGATLEHIEACVVHTDIAEASTFECSDELLNRIDSNVRWTFRASFQGYPQDAADRGERIGWLGETGWLIQDLLFTFEGYAFWAKWLDDIRDTQLEDGRVSIVAPHHLVFAHDWPDWTATYPLVLWQLYSFSGDREILGRHYDGIRELLAWYSAKADDGIVSAGLGDHMEPRPDGASDVVPTLTPIALTSTAWLFAVAEIVASTADVLGDRGGAEDARAIATVVRERFTDVFFDPTTSRFGTGSQTSMALPLWVGLVQPDHRLAVAEALVRDVRDRDDGHLWTGTMGTAALEHVLAEHGGADTMFDIATQTTFPSWGDQIRRGATTVWETWGTECIVPGELGGLAEPEVTLPGSKNMKLLAAVSSFLIRDVAGLGPAAAGWQRVRVRPALTHRLAHARSRISTPRGAAAISWQREGAHLIIELEVPATSIAEVRLPLVGFHSPDLQADADVVGLRRVGDELCFEVGGGLHHFVLAESGHSRGH